MMQWSHDLVQDNSSILGNSGQIGNDCGLHTMILPILLQDRLFLQVFGNTEKEKTLFSIEMRRRAMLSVYFGKLFFEPDVQKILELEEKSRRGRIACVKNLGGGQNTKNKEELQISKECTRKFTPQIG